MPDLVPIISKNDTLSNYVQEELINLKHALTKLQASYTMPMGEIKEDFKNLIDSKGYIIDYNIHGDFRLDIDGIKKGIAIQAQFGNAARFYADLMKLEYLYQSNQVTEGIYVCFTRDFVYNHFSSNIITIERVVPELELFQKLITIPLGLISLDIKG